MAFNVVLCHPVNVRKVYMPEAWDTGTQLDMVLRLGVNPDRIVFANACKRPRDIRAAASKQVILCPRLMKMPSFHPEILGIARSVLCTLQPACVKCACDSVQVQCSL